MRKVLSKALVVVLLAALVGLPACAGQQDAATDASSEEENTSLELREQTVPATEENVRLIGRTCRLDDVTWLPQSGSGIRFEVTGTHAELNLVGDEGIKNEPELRPRFAVFVDGEPVADDLMNESSRSLEVLSSDTDKTAVVEVLHLSEANQGAVGVAGITVESREADPVKPTPAKDLSIEFIGDSITCGYGVESTSEDEPFTTADENFVKTYAFYTAMALDADYETVCYSGYGIVSGWSADGERNTDMILPPYYPLVSKDYDEPWDFETHPCDIVVINLGTNDTTYTGSDPDRMQEFADGYVDFLVKVREAHPESYVICTFGAMGGEELYPYLEQAVESFKTQTGDTRVTCYLTDRIDEEVEGVGTNGHPNSLTQQRNADQLVEVIQQVLSADE